MKPLRDLLSRAALLLTACLFSCSDAGDSTFSAETAQDVARRFHEALVKGDAGAAAALARAPFWYKDRSRVWPDAAALEKNLAKEIPRFQHLLVGLDQLEAFSHGDLMEGRWPRGRSVEKDRLEPEIRALGLLENGWLVRVHSRAKAGYLLVLNGEGIQRLAVQGLDI